MSLIGSRARNHPLQTARRRAMRQQLTMIGTEVDHTDAVDDRWTPPDVFDPLNQRHRFTVDAAASAENALLPVYWTRADDGLQQDWTGHRVWCNPPYSACAEWVAKATLEMQFGCELVVMLLPANRTEQAWWQNHIEPHRDQGGVVETRFLRGRIRFGRPAGAPIPVGGDRPPFGLVVVTWRPA